MRERGLIPIMTVTRLSSLCERLTSTHFGSTVAMCFSARVVAKCSKPTTTSTDTRSLNTGAFATSPCGARGEEKKSKALASSWKRADLLYHLNWKSVI